MSREFDADVEQDELLARGGLYEVDPVPGTGWKFLVGIGVVLTALGIVFDLTALDGILPLPDYDPTPLGSALLLAVMVVGLICLVAGIALGVVGRSRPPRPGPIV